MRCFGDVVGYLVHGTPKALREGLWGSWLRLGWMEELGGRRAEMGGEGWLTTLACGPTGPLFTNTQNNCHEATLSCPVRQPSPRLDPCRWSSGARTPVRGSGLYQKSTQRVHHPVRNGSTASALQLPIALFTLPSIPRTKVPTQRNRWPRPTTGLTATPPCHP